jgi:hypothetical protein
VWPVGTCPERGPNDVPLPLRQGRGLGHDAVVVDTDSQGVGVPWSENSNAADDFSKNLIRARAEGRFGTSVLSPLGVVPCDLTA